RPAGADEGHGAQGQGGGRALHGRAVEVVGGGGHDQAAPDTAAQGGQADGGVEVALVVGHEHRRALELGEVAPADHGERRDELQHRDQRPVLDAAADQAGRGGAGPGGGGG